METEKTTKEAKEKPPRKKSGVLWLCYRFLKRSFDILSSGLFLILFCWVYLILAAAVRCSDGGPAIYSHARVGKGGKDIRLPKFRTMKKNADSLQNELSGAEYAEYKKEYKVNEDPRVTKLGRALRRTSLDELPNFWSVFKGDLSLVGPRPVMRDELTEKYGSQAERFVSVRPGMIGMWAANGRSNCTYESGKRQEYELYYVDHCSLWLDVKIICKTAVSVFKHTGAK